MDEERDTWEFLYLLAVGVGWHGLGIALSHVTGVFEVLVCLDIMYFLSLFLV